MRMLALLLLLAACAAPLTEDQIYERDNTIAANIDIISKYIRDCETAGNHIVYTGPSTGSGLRARIKGWQINQHSMLSEFVCYDDIY